MFGDIVLYNSQSVYSLYGSQSKHSICDHCLGFSNPDKGTNTVEMKATNIQRSHFRKILQKIAGGTDSAGKRYRTPGNNKTVTPLLPLKSFSKGFSWPSKISFVLFSIKQGTAEDVAAEIAKLEGITSQEGIAEVTLTVTDFLEKLFQIGKIASRIKTGKNVYSLIHYKSKKGSKLHNKLFRG